MTDIEAIRARAAAATRGPWRWRGNTDFDCPRLVGERGDVLALIRREREPGDPETKAYERFLREASISDPNVEGGYRPYTDEEVAQKVEDEWLTDPWGEPQEDNRLHLYDPEAAFYRPARDLAVFEVCPEATGRDDRRVYRADIIGLRNPNAIFLEHARQDVDDLLAALDQVAAERDAARLDVEVTNSAAKILADDLKRANTRVAELEEAAHEPRPCEMCQAMEETVAAADAERDRLERELAQARAEIERLRAVPEVRGGAR